MMRLSLAMHHSLHTLLFNVSHRSSSANGVSPAARRPTLAGQGMHHMMNNVDSMHHVLYT
jgi:hypothetical protein